ncbi:uncharacterized protein PHACADRAFT_263872 [Phanerochaete carnosa HHB-10118-sp]|uniref:Uncharacterized protein n=1 Tax=Phanerochaete carnosa (strain HHB-10118-sp) TaxID=650164 RepID=K5ULI8_PHACS|nr:uncharacterized protein PHACADRAFT_263872 [Phanerochaete carnosa HHB-10118-sp]EKM50536.1 hypothetical protein PHACADRAFT_263872 [Phanerochaete carnosa HHB-10118-sp]
MSHETRYVLPGPAAADLFAPLTRAEVESLVLSVSLTERRWKLPRKPPKLLEASEVVCSAEEPMHTGMSILNMNILADRWLVVLYQGDAVEIWDLCPNSGSSASGVTRAWNGPGPEDTPCAPCAIRHTVQGLGPCCMSAVVLSEDGRDIILAVGR